MMLRATLRRVYGDADDMPWRDDCAVAALLLCCHAAILLPSVSEPSTYNLAASVEVMITLLITLQRRREI